jgi:soluble lytic murein transglycosylase-like protein
MKRIVALVIALAGTCVPRPVPADGEVLAFSRAMIRMSTSKHGWTRFRGLAGEQKALALAAIFWDESRKANLDPYLVAAVAQKESDFRIGLLGSRGEVGIMQSFASDWRTANGLRASYACRETTEKLRKDALAAIRCGVRELAAHIKQCDGDVARGLSSYNSGNCDSEAGLGYAKRVLRILARGQTGHLIN